MSSKRLRFPLPVYALVFLAIFAAGSYVLMWVLNAYRPVLWAALPFHPRPGIVIPMWVFLTMVFFSAEIVLIAKLQKNAPIMLLFAIATLLPSGILWVWSVGFAAFHGV